MQKKANELQSKFELFCQPNSELKKRDIFAELQQEKIKFREIEFEFGLAKIG